MTTTSATARELNWSLPVYPQLPVEPVRGDGVYLETRDGRRLLDLYGGHAVASLGYGHPRLTKAVADQSRDLLFQSNAVPNRQRAEACEALARFAPDGLDRVFLVNSGAEANENALRLAFHATGRSRVVAVEGGFHGRTAAAGAVSWGSAGKWYAFPRTPFDVTFVARDDTVALERAVDEEVAAVIVEPVQGVAGAVDLDPAFLRAARTCCTATGAMLIFDEVQCGMGRSGFPFMAQAVDVTPDLLTTAKGLAGGLPAGAVMTNVDIADSLAAGALGTTFGGGPVACVAISAVIGAIRDEDLMRRVREVSAAIEPLCAGGVVEGVQGRGLLVGLRTRPPARTVRDALLEMDILAGTSGDPHVLRLLPPLILEMSHVELLADALRKISS